MPYPRPAGLFWYKLWLPSLRSSVLALLAISGQLLLTNGEAAEAVRTIDLEFTEAPHRIWQWQVPCDPGLTRLKAPPQAAGATNYCGLLRLGSDTNQFIPFSWVPASGKLYLDLNRNLDLGDDPAGILQCEAPGITQAFTNVRLAVRDKSGPHPLTLDLKFSADGGNLRVTAELRSFWAAKADVGGNEWQFGLVESYDGRSPIYWLVRPWSMRDEDFAMLSAGSSALVNPPRKLFIQTEAYDASYEYSATAEKPHYTIRLSEQKPQLGALELAGSYVHRLILEEPKGFTAVLDSPSGTVRVPVGNYRRVEVWVRKGGAEAAYVAQTELQVTAQGGARLVAGGPLTNMVTAVRHGRNLTASYELLGAGGIAFRLNSSTNAAPRVAVYHSGKQLASGTFEFG